ncbi:MAG: hypothetical protein JO362_22070 [Streptomycetaceae bacterium]|nr:hypothetical protein [Streptomycetaceae bacterium]
MAGVRGLKQSGRTGKFDPEEVVTLTLRFRPDDPYRPLYEELVKRLDVSGAEVARRGMKALHDELSRTGWTPAEEARIAS